MAAAFPSKAPAVAVFFSAVKSNDAPMAVKFVRPPTEAWLNVNAIWSMVAVVPPSRHCSPSYEMVRLVIVKAVLFRKRTSVARVVVELDSAPMARSEPPEDP